VLTYRGDLGWGQVKGHLQGLVLIERLDRQLIYALQKVMSIFLGAALLLDPRDSV
jgi:hypothetical protein